MIWDANETAARYGLEHIARLIYFDHLAPDDTERRRTEVGRLIDLHGVDSVITAARELIARYRTLQQDAAEIASRAKAS